MSSSSSSSSSSFSCSSGPCRPAACNAVDQSALPANSVPPAKSSSSPFWRTFRNVSFAAIGVGSAVTALAGSRYLVPSVQPTLPPPIVNNAFARPFLYIHVGCAATALMLGPLQFVTSLRRRYPAVHRAAGRVYVVGCLIGGVAAMPIALHSFGGPIAQSGFFTLAVSWLIVNSNAWQLAVAGHISEHKRWMVRSFALTFAAVSLRVMIGTFPALGMSFMTAYRISAWAWMPNLLLVEAWMRYFPDSAMVVGDDSKSERLLEHETPGIEGSAAGSTMRRA